MNNPPELLFSLLTKDFQGLKDGLQGNQVTLFGVPGAIDTSKHDSQFTQECEVSDLEDLILTSVHGEVNEVTQKDGALFALVANLSQGSNFCWVELNASTLITIH